MLSALLHSRRPVAVGIEIMRAFDGCGGSWSATPTLPPASTRWRADTTPIFEVYSRPSGG